MLEPYIIQASSFDPSAYDSVHSSPSVYILNSIDNSPRHSLDSSHALSDDQHPSAKEGLSLVQSINKVSPPLYDSAQPDLHPLPHRLNVGTQHQHLRSRSLTDALLTNVENEMTAFATEAPGSPPGLSGSKSSKSSSFHSSSLSGTDGILSDITHFEEIGLEEDHYHPISPKRPTHGMEKQPSRPLPRTSATTTSGHRSNAAAMTAMRELTNTVPRHSYPRIPGLGKGHAPTHSLSLPNDGIMRKSHRNASTPSLAIKAMSNCNRSRSPSPNAGSPLARPLSAPKTPHKLGPKPVDQNRPPIRRGSWQPSRKSVKELEAEYNDEDEDLPEDASLWNVPLSPRPPGERSPIAIATSPKVSPRTSPERPSPLRTSLSALSPDSPHTVAPVLTGSAISPNLSSPISSFWKPKTTRGASTGTLPDHFNCQPSRSMSWTVVLSELSDEAKALTETLENHALSNERKRESAIQSGTGSPSPDLDKLSRAKTSTIELPPLRLNNVMIDPLPVSKEKEKVLTRTRPSWLPPKSQKEEKKHLKEYQRMMELSREAERRKAASLVDHQCAKDDTKKALLRIWEEHVLPNWDQVIREPRTRELWWRGVAPKSRAQVWQKAVGNELALTEVTYEKALKRAKEIEKRISEGSGGEEHRNEKMWFDAIRRDVKVAFPELNIFQSGAPLHDGLVDVLMAYSMYRSDVGYSHGTHLIAALLLLTLPSTQSAFLTLSNLLNRPLPLAFLTGDPAATTKTYHLTLSLLATKYPRLHAHLFGDSPASSSSLSSPSLLLNVKPDVPSTPSLNLAPSLVLEPMFRTLFLSPGGGLGIDTAARVWDVILFDGDAAMIRTAVAVFGCLEGKLYGDRDSVLKTLGWGGGGWASNIGSEEAFMAKVREVEKEVSR